MRHVLSAFLDLHVEPPIDPEDPADYYGPGGGQGGNGGGGGGGHNGGDGGAGGRAGGGGGSREGEDSDEDIKFLEDSNDPETIAPAVGAGDGLSPGAAEPGVIAEPEPKEPDVAGSMFHSPAERLVVTESGFIDCRMFLEDFTSQNYKTAPARSKLKRAGRTMYKLQIGKRRIFKVEDQDSSSEESSWLAREECTFGNGYSETGGETSHREEVKELALHTEEG